MTTDEEKHTQIMTRLQDLNTKFDEVIKPAITQTYENKDDIIKIKFFQSITKYIGGLVTTAVMFVTVRSIWDWIKSHS